MEELLKETSELVKSYLHRNGLHFIANNIYLLSLIAVFLLYPIVKSLIKFLSQKIRAYILERDLSPNFDNVEINKATELFVETEFQNVDPANDNDYLSNEIYAARERLIPFFIKKTFRKNSTERFFLILADSGMGKTTLLINLYLRYIKRLRKRSKIKLFPLGKKGIEREINLIESNEKKNTILLLDAFDEDQKAVNDSSQRMNELIELSKDFKKIIITSRTHFFTSSVDEPSETGLMKFGGDKGQHYFHKLYLSPFNDRAIKTYLNKKYSLFLFRKKRRATQIVRQCPNLMMRPMLLNYIDDLVNSKRIFHYSYQIYHLLIEKWIEREATRITSRERDSFREQLHNFSSVVALNIYEKQKLQGELFIEAGEIAPLALQNNIDLSELDLRSRSLLNRNSAGRYKFSHKSILEFFLALEMYKNNAFRENFNNESMPQARLFYLEMCQREIDSKAMNLNKTVPYNQTIFLGLRKFISHYIDISLSFNLKKQKTITILNLDEIDENVIAGMANVEYLNILVCKFENIEKFYSLTKLKAICLLNECGYMKSQMNVHIYHSQPGESEEYISDLKKLIFDLYPNLDLDTQINIYRGKKDAIEELRATQPFREVNERAGEAWMNSERLAKIKGTYDSIFTELNFLYFSVALRNIKSKFKEHSKSKHLTFFNEPLDENGRLIKV